MITKKDLSDFFDYEVDAAMKNWEASMKLPIDERIRKRRAIQLVYLSHDHGKKSEEGYPLIKVYISVNLSDFKEGECLLLHKENAFDGIQCTLISFVGDDELILELFSYNIPSDFDSYYNVPLVLDRCVVDLRKYIYGPFLSQVSFIDKNLWNKSFFNRMTIPTFENLEENETELNDTISNYNLDLLPCQKEAVIKSMSTKCYYLIQGPPGTGKSFILALIMLEELVFFSHKVIVIGPNHMAINNILYQVLKMEPHISPRVYKVGQSYHAPANKVYLNNEEYLIKNFQRINSSYANNIEGSWLIGLTPHSLYSSRARYLECDTLIIDEAGQMTIPLALMGMIKAKKVILAGDHKQLHPIVSSNEVRREMRQSIFQYLLNEKNCTMLDVSFRMCEPICDFVSDLFYEGKIKSNKHGCGDLIVCSDPLLDFHTPIVIHHVNDNGEQTSDKEADFIADTVARFIKEGLPANEVAVLSPFRAQASNIKRRIKKHPDIAEEYKVHIISDTVDKMQGQEREVIMFSLVSGKFDYMTEMAEFLYNPNKMNVAFSRAKSKLIIVGNIEQIKKIKSVNYPHIKRMLESRLVKFV